LLNRIATERTTYGDSLISILVLAGLLLVLQVCATTVGQGLQPRSPRGDSNGAAFDWRFTRICRICPALLTIRVAANRVF
jgi:hypothetical protein